MMGSFLECWHARTKSLQHYSYESTVGQITELFWKQVVLGLEMKDLNLVQNPGQFWLENRSPPEGAFV